MLREPLNSDWVEACAALVDEDRPTMRALALSIARKHGINLAEMKSLRRTKNIWVARREFYFRAATELGKSQTQIGIFLDNRSHTTVGHGIRRYKEAHAWPVSAQ